MFEGYLTVGGNEVINSARALGYTLTAPCPINWLVCAPCDGVRDARGDGLYNIDTISTAPWYDVEDEPTHRFYGVHGVLVEGVEDSSRTADVTEGIGDGGVVGQVRYASKRIRVRAMLSAKGRDALAAGFAWLDASLRANACGTHGASCGATDVGFFVDCPPDRASIVSPVGLEWLQVAENLFRRPQATTDWALQGLSGAVAADPGGAYLHATVEAPGAAYVDLTTPETRVPITGHVTLTYQVEVRLGADTAAAVLRLLWLDADGNFIPSGTQDGVPTMSKEWTRLAVTATSPSGAVAAGLYVLLATDQPLGATVDVRRVMAEHGHSVSTYYDGDTPAPGELERYVWRGSGNDSTSAREIGTPLLAPDEVVYQRLVDQMERTLHNVTCVSGPTIEETLNRGDAWGYIVEFVLVAATPWIFSVTRPVQLPPNLPVVVQDVPFNLVPYPSAELASGTVLVSTNYTTNPSVEASATGWSAGSTGVVAGDVAGSQSSALSSVGTKSFLTHFAASNSGTGGTLLAINDSTPFPAVTAGQRMSVTMWTTAIKLSGTAVLGPLKVYAVWKAGSTVVRTDLIGAAPTGGGAVSKDSISPPIGVTSCLVQAQLTLTSWSTGAAVDVYADALAVTVP